MWTGVPEQVCENSCEARIALITTAGFYLPGQQPFDQSYRHDDCSFREIPWGTQVETLQIGQSSDVFDRSGIEADRNLALPLDRLRELIDTGVVGDAAPRHFSIIGSLIVAERKDVAAGIDFLAVGLCLQLLGRHVVHP